MSQFDVNAGAVQSGDGHESNDIGERLLARNLINAEQLATARRVLKQSHGKRMAQVLIEMGVDEAAVQEQVASLSRLPFERIADDDPTAMDLKAMHKLGPDYCRSNLVLPLRREGSRLVVGTASPDDLFVLDDVKRRLNVARSQRLAVRPDTILEID